MSMRRPLETNCLEDVRVNFGVQQLPLFNLLKPEEVDWHVAIRDLKVEED